MLPLPASLVPLVRAVVEGEVRSARKVTGGYESNSFKLTTSRASYFVKWSADGKFAQEQRGLELIRATGTIRVPNVLAARDADVGQPGFLVQEWLEPPKGDPLAQRTGAQLGEALARLHLAPAPIDGYARELAEPFGSWVDCYREGCLRPAIEAAAQRGQMPPARRATLERLMGRLDGLLGDVPRKPSLLHGDFHRGNVLEAKGGEMVIIDPHPWVGDREVELAHTEWQFRFPPRFYSAYEALYPSFPGRAERRDLYLVWLALRWGGARVAQVDALLRWYVTPISPSAAKDPSHLPTTHPPASPPTTVLGAGRRGDLTGLTEAADAPTTTGSTTLGSNPPRPRSPRSPSSSGVLLVPRRPPRAPSA